MGGVVLAVTLQWVWPESVVMAWSIAAGALFVYGCLETKFVERVWKKKDPGEFVLDEVVGYLVTVLVYALISGAAPMAFGHMVAFFAFRVFDVLKTQPARRFEDLPGAVGIMADDQIAGLYAGLSMWLVMYVLGQ